MDRHHIHIAGQHISLGESLQEYVTEKIQSLVHKYLEQTISSFVRFTKHVHNNIIDCEIILDTGNRTKIKTNAESYEAYYSFDLAYAKLEKRLRKYKSKLKDYHQAMKAVESLKAQKYVINIEKEAENLEREDSSNAPVIIAEKAIEIMRLSVKEAVMKMELENLPALAFTNIDSGRLNIVYYRRDRNISWVDYNLDETSR